MSQRLKTDNLPSPFFTKKMEHKESTLVWTMYTPESPISFVYEENGTQGINTMMDNVHTIVIHFHRDVVRGLHALHLHKDALFDLGGEADGSVLEIGGRESLRLVKLVTHHVVLFQVDSHLC